MSRVYVRMALPRYTNSVDALCSRHGGWNLTLFILRFFSLHVVGVVARPQSSIAACQAFVVLQTAVL